MAITCEETIALQKAFHDVVMIKKGTGAEQSRYFLHPEPRIILLHGEDVTLQQNYEIHQKLTDELHRTMEWDVTPLCEKPERVRAIGCVYWQGRVVGLPEGALIKCFVGEDWIIQRIPSGELRIALYINTYHHFLPDSAPISFT